jgi:diguanylate cyclase (GGDEF)-like protein
MGYAGSGLLPPPLADRPQGGARAECIDFMAHAGDRLRQLRAHGTPFSLLWLSLDQLEAVNEALGPLWCEALLGVAATRISQYLRPADRSVWLGGDTFAVLLGEIGDAPGALAAATRIQRRLGTPFVLAGHELFATASVGVAVADSGYGHVQDLLRDAHAAMREARSHGPGLCETFQPAMHTRALDRLKLESSLRRALERAEFELHYQPIVDLRSGLIASFEALLRWNHPQRGQLAPAEFLRAAHDSGVVVPLGRWVLAEACRQAAQWDAQGAPLAVAVNLSAHQLRHPGVQADVEDALVGAGLPANRLHLEITESAIIESGEAAVETLCRLKALGVRLCLDDFGVGYSGLSYLTRFPVDVLKIDRSFVAGLDSAGVCHDIERAVVSLARRLGIDVIPEGVENLEQLRQLRELGCDFAQGYLFSRPVAAADAAALMAAGPRW